MSVLTVAWSRRWVALGSKPSWMGDEEMSVSNLGGGLDTKDSGSVPTPGVAEATQDDPVPDGSDEEDFFVKRR